MLGRAVQPDFLRWSLSKSQYAKPKLMHQYICTSCMMLGCPSGRLPSSHKVCDGSHFLQDACC